MTDPRPLDRYLDEFGGTLRARRPPARRVAAARVALPVCATVGALAVVLLSGNDAARPVDAVAAARAAVVVQPGEIVHLQVVTYTTAAGGLHLAARVRALLTTDVWASENPRRWRLVERIPAGRGVRGPLRTEVAFARGAQSSYDTARKRLYIREGLSEQGQAAQVPGLFGTDPAQTILRLLRSGQAADLGIVRHDGRDVRRLRVTRRQGRLDDVLTYDVDPRTFTPVSGQIRTRLPVQPPGRGGRAAELIRHYEVKRFERIPLNARTARLLEIQAPGNATVQRVTAAEAARRIARRAARCTTRANGAWVCRSR